MNRFDEIFSQKAAKAFISYNADHMADTGWDSFIKKYKRKPRSGIVIPFWAKAASVAILLTVGIVYTYKTIERKTDIAIIEVEKPIKAEKTKPLITDKVVIDDNVVLASTKPSSAGRIEKRMPVVNPDEKNPDSGVLKLSDSGESESLKIPVKVHLQDITYDHFENGLIEIGQEQLKHKKVTLVEPDIVSHYSRKTTLMAGISGMMAKVEDIASSAQGVAIGFYIEHELTRRISVRPGLAMARQTYDLENTSGTKAFGYTAPALNGLSGSLDSYEAQIEILSMEVPVNFVLSIWERRKSNLFVSTGISTVIYLKQHLTGSFRNMYSRENIDMATGETFYETNYTMVDIESKHEAFSRVDYFGLANFSAGYSLPFGKDGSLLFEPFVQLPVNNLTSLNLRIRYGGLSLKIKF